MQNLRLCLQIANKGLVSFGKKDKGKRLKLKAHKKMICPYNSDIGAPKGQGGQCLTPIFCAWVCVSVWVCVCVCVAVCV